MNVRIAAIALASASLMLPGCIAAIVPVAAAGAIGGKQALGRNQTAAQAPSDKSARKAERRQLKDQRRRDNDARKRAQGVGNAPYLVPSATPAQTTASAVPGGMQYLYASGEAAAVSMQAYLQLMNYLLAVSSDGSVGHPVQSVVLAPGTTLAQGKFVPCGKKPLAMVLDVDETAILNTGFEGDQVTQGGAYDQQRWEAWERSATAAQVEAVPGAISAANVARGAGIAVVFNSNRSAAYAAQTSALLAAAGFGKVVHGDTLWLQGDAGTGSGKDARRAAIAAKYCVVAMVGDQLGDFSDLFNDGTSLAERRRLITSREVQTMWGHGWFILPNPVYGTGVRGGMDEVFPPATRWTPDTPQENK
jgi:5'-nucleotidase (lipoprotein e(P4) family)